jgi:hypothetical protein
LTGLGFTQTEDKIGHIWSSGSAYILPVGRIEVGLFQPLRYGFSNSLEFSTHPLVNILMPNFKVKWSHNFVKKITVATQHSFYYPTPLLRTIAREGTGGIISPEFHIPHLFAFYNEILVSKYLNKNLLFTGKAGFVFALHSAALDERTTIDLPLIFPRLSVFYHGYGFRFGGDLSGKIYHRWHHALDFDIFLNPGAEENVAFEHKGLLLWNKSQRLQICLGYKLVYGEYPFGTQWHFLAPLFDLQWAWQRR